MAPFGVAAIIAAGLFIGGTAIKPQEPVLGTVLQGAGIGTLIGGGIGAAAGAGSGVASFFGTTTLATTVGATAVAGAAAGTVGAAVVANNQSKKAVAKAKKTKKVRHASAR
jgi:hypothetical protein